MLRLGHFEVDETHAVEVEAPTCEVRVELTDPRTGETVAVEGARVCLIGKDGAPASAEGTTDLDGEASLVITNVEAGAVLQLDLRGKTLFDFEAQELVADDAAEAVESRPLMRLPEVWRSDGQSALNDDLGGSVVDGRLPDLESGGVGMAETPWIVRLDHAWTGIDVVFEFYDTQECGLSALEQGLMVEAFEGTSFSPHTRMGGGTVAGDDGLHFLRLFREVAPASLHLRVVAPGGTFLELTNRSIPLRRWRTHERGTVTPLGQRLERYDVPEHWCSRGQYASLDGGATARPFDEIAAELLEGGQTVHFDLDDMLLVDGKFRPVDIRSVIPVTVFGGDFVVKRPSEQEPQHSEVTIERAHLRGRDAYHFDMEGDGGAPRLHATTRVIRRGRRFYDLDGSRTTEGEVIGVRRAVRDAHPKIAQFSEGVKGGFPHQVEFHLFEDVGMLDVDGVAHSARVALVYASVRLLPHLGSNPSDADLVAVRKGFADAAQRWTGEPLSIPLAEETPVGRQIYVVEEEQRRATKFVFHFPTIEKGVGTIGAFLVTKRKKFRAHAGPLHMTLKIPEDVETTVDESKVEQFVHAQEDGRRFDAVVVHHELGHIMGLPDEYLEKGGLDLPQFFQRSRSLIHGSDADSMMNGAKVPMLRHYGVLARALHQHQWFGSEPVAFCDTRRIAGAEGRVHRYATGLAASAFSELAELELGPKKARYTAVVGVLGDDFDALSHTAAVDGVLMLSPRLYLRGRGKELDPGAKPDRAVELRNFGASLSEALLSERRPVFRRTSGGNSSGLPRRIALAFEPRFSRANFGAADLRVHVVFPSEYEKRGPFDARRNLAFVRRGGGATLVRYLLGLPVEQQPMLRCSEGGSKLKFQVGLETFTFSEATSAAPKKDEYVSKVVNPKGGFTPLPGHDVAKNLAEAINAPGNSAHPFLSAVAQGADVILEEKNGAAVVVDAVVTSVEVVSRFKTEIEPAEFAGLAAALGAALGETYEVEG